MIGGEAGFVVRQRPYTNWDEDIPSDCYKWQEVKCNMSHDWGRFINAEARVPSRNSPCGTCHRVFSPGRPTSVFRCHLVSIVSDYRLEGFYPRQRQKFISLVSVSRPALRPTQPPVHWVPGISSGVTHGRGVTLTAPPPLVPRLRMSRS
jgi:hypothetical protein